MIKPALLDTDYRFRDDLTINDETTPIELIGEDSPWVGVIYRYSAANILPPDENNPEAKLQFAFEFINVPDGFVEEELRKDIGFNSYVGNILNSLILDWITSGGEIEEDEE